MAVALAAVGGLLVGWCLSVLSLRLGDGVPLLEGGVPAPTRRDLLTALATAALWVAVVLIKHGANEILLGLALVAVLVPITLTDLELAAYERALAPKRLVTIEGGHFDPYLGQIDVSSTAAVDWFRQHLA